MRHTIFQHAITCSNPFHFSFQSPFPEVNTNVPCSNEKEAEQSNDDNDDQEDHSVNEKEVPRDPNRRTCKCIGECAYIVGSYLFVYCMKSLLILDFNTHCLV